MDEDDKKLWEAFVSAEQQVGAARVAFFQKARSRRGVLAAALNVRAPYSHQSAALTFLSALPEDVPGLLDQLVELATIEASTFASKKVIKRGVTSQPEIVTPKLRGIIRSRLADPQTDEIDYRLLAELLRYIHDNEMLAELVQFAKASSDDEIREVGEDFSQE